MYEPVIGLEIHAQIATKTKLFCSCSNDSFGKEPNVNTCPICVGHPGQLPVLNKDAVQKGIRASLALNCTVNEYSKFDRKNYFYPDLPLGYQISQFDQPLAEHGSVDVELSDGSTKQVGVTRLHLENDAGKLTHISSGSLCDYNRSGAPLMEIVSEPDLRSPEEAVLYAKEIQKIVRAVGASNADMEKGMMRFDLNISIRKGPDAPFGTKVEIKNLNSFRALEKACTYEIARQSKMLEAGEEIMQETRGFQDDKEITVSQRTKEDAHDYRYFPEPDLPPMTFSKADIDAIAANLPELPSARKQRYIADLKLSNDVAAQLSSDADLGVYFDKVLENGGDAKKASSVILSVLTAYMNKDRKGVFELGISPEDLGALLGRIDAGELSMNSVKIVLEALYENGGGDIDAIITEKNLVQVSDTGELESIAKEILDANAQSIEDFKNGKDKAFGFLVGQMMKATKGKANPKMAAEILKKML